MSAGASADSSSDGEPEPTYVGCFSSEAMFQGREYTGGASGAQYNLIKYEAITKNRTSRLREISHPTTCP